MRKYCKDDKEIKSFWDAHKIGEQFHYMDLLNMYGRQKAIPTSTTHNDPDILAIKGKI